MDEEIIEQIKQEYGLDIYELLEDHNIEVGEGYVSYESLDDIDEFLSELVDQIGEDEAAKVVSGVEEFEERYTELFERAPFVSQGTEEGKTIREIAEEMPNDELTSAIDTQVIDDFYADFNSSDVLKNSPEQRMVHLYHIGVDTDTHKLRDIKLFRKAIDDFDRNISTGNKEAIDLESVKEYLDALLIDYAPEEKSEIKGEAGRYLLYKLLKSFNPPSADKIGEIIDDFEISVVDIPASYNRKAIINVLNQKALKEVNVEAGNTKYISRDGIVFNPEETELLIFPSNRGKTDYTIPPKVRFIEGEAYHAMSTLESIDVDPNNPFYSSIDGVLYDSNGVALFCYPSARKEKSYTFPKSVDHIYEDSLYGAESLEEITIGVTSGNRSSIGQMVFELKKQLPNIKVITLIPQSHKEILMTESDKLTPEEESDYSKYLTEFKLATKLIGSQEFDLVSACSYVKNIIKTFGEDEAAKILMPPQVLKKGTVEQLAPALKKQILESYEEKFHLKGTLPITTDIFKYLNGQMGKSKGKELFARINKVLEGDSGNKSFYEIIISTARDLNIDLDEENFKKVYDSIIQKEYRRNELSIKGAISTKIRSRHDVSLGHSGVILSLLEKIIRENYLEEGNVDSALNKLKSKFQEVNDDGTLVYQGILNNRLLIEEMLKELYIEAPSLIQNDTFKKVQKTKQIVGKSWILKLINGSNRIDLDNMTELDVNRLKKCIGTEASQTLAFDSDYELKPYYSQLRTYMALDAMHHEQLMTYEKAEMMFSSIPYLPSAKFNKWFMDNKEEIMQRSDVYSVIPEIHRLFESNIANDSITNTILNNGELGVDQVLEKYLTILGKGPNNIHDQLSYWAFQTGVYRDDHDIDEIERIFEVTKKRERSYIPSAESEKKVEKVTYRGRILRADDPLNLLLGNATQCCQKVGGVGENSMRHAAMEDTGRTFVVEEIDENGNSKIVAQSWVWRNNGVLCFDNIEITPSELSELKSGTYHTAIEKQKAILHLYKETAEKILEKDRKKFDKLLKEGKITQEQYDAFVLTMVTVGTGYNDLGYLKEAGLEGISFDEEDGPLFHLDKSFYNEKVNDGKAWIDSGMNHGKDGTQLILAGSMEEREKQDKKRDIKEIPLELMYKNSRELIKTKGVECNRVIDDIKSIEEKSYRSGQKIMQYAKNYKDIARQFSINPAEMQIIVSADKDWYMIFVEEHKQIYIADLAALGGRNSQSKDKKDAYFQSLEIMKSVYELMQRAAIQGKTVYLNATEDTSYPSILSMARKGVVKINSDNKRSWNYYSDIKMHDMELTVDLEKVTEQLDKVNRILAKRKESEWDR